ncbi:MAG: hypothetical protein MUE44_28785 [Oscillatoriaceae cyanobacterium Prado104]|jgi:very-short-patch-repair endonuclease|nr:hypothetical protein [Oscillatoriaceae cyanobacterium Prado104]
MNYPMVFYPEAIVKFSRQNPLVLPENQQVYVSCANSLSDLEDQARTSNKSAITPQPFKLPKLLSIKFLWSIWVLWLASTIALTVIAAAWGLSWLELLLFFGAYSCIIAAVYIYVLNCRSQFLSGYKRELFDNNQQKALCRDRQLLSGIQVKEAISKEMAQQMPQSNLSIEPTNRLQLRYKALANLMKSRVSSIGNSKAQQGVSERKFWLYLQQYFPTAVQGVEFKIPMSHKSYSADFIVLHLQSRIGIDIEIDEPYCGRSKKPTHCCDADSDIRRNQLFLEWNWIVIRFTEKQVVQAPLSCCKFIALAIAEVTGDRSFLEQLKTEPDLLPVKPWTTREARVMAKSNYRLTYLPKFGAIS